MGSMYVGKSAKTDNKPSAFLRVEKGRVVRRSEWRHVERLRTRYGLAARWRHCYIEVDFAPYCVDLVRLVVVYCGRVATERCVSKRPT